MKAILAVFASVAFPLSADTVTWKTYTGWDHGYTLTVDGEAATITLGERLAQGKAGEEKVQKIPGSVAFVAYVKNLVEMIPEGEIGSPADDGRIIEVTVKSKGKTIIREINEIELYMDPRLFGSVKDPNGTKLVGEALDKGVRKEVAQFKKWAEAYMLQEMMFDLKKRYFANEK